MKNTTITRDGLPAWQIVLSAVLLLTLSACSSDDDNDDDVSDSETTSFDIVADGAQEVPATASDASATGTFALDETTGELIGSVETSGIVTDSAHLHDAFAGTNGDVIITLEVDGDTIAVPESTILTADQQAALLSGRYYLNIHSSEFPAGELRDQLTPEGVSVHLVALSGDQEVPSVDSAGSGTAYVTVDDDSGSTVINVITSGLTTPDSAHLHGGFAGSNGDVLHALVQDTSEVGNFSSDGAIDLSAEELASLQAGGTYINVHTAENPSGELRGQVLPAGVSLLSATLSGEQEVPAVATAASGSGVVTLNENDGTVTAFVIAQDIPTANAGHIHAAPVGENGDVVVTLTQDTEDSGLFSVESEAISADDIDTLNNGGMYFNIHTPENPGGEIRGQIE